MNEKYREEMIRRMVEADLEEDIYGGNSLAVILYCPQRLSEADRQIYRVASWFRLPHPRGRDHQGEPDFAANKLIRTLYLAENRLSRNTRGAVYTFFTEENFESKYKSENHMLLFRTARYLYALKYPETSFRQYHKNAKEILDEDRNFLHDFIEFRARRGWAEFDSLGYGAECFSALLNLIDFGEKELSRYAWMSADVFLMDMIGDCSKDGLYGGAHGRVYEKMVMDFRNAPMCAVYQYYFGNEIYPWQGIEIVSSGYRPSEYVYAMLNSQPESWENFECKHLHSITENIPQRQLPQVPGNINKYTYVTPWYVIGAVNWQDDYPAESEAGWYAHHQQHEWELTLCGETDLRIFTHHPGCFGTEGKEHGYWTGDLGCSCGSFYCRKNVVMALYEIPDTALAMIHTHIPLKKLEIERDGRYLWFRKGKAVYGMLWSYCGFEKGSEKYMHEELISRGRRHAVVCMADAGEHHESWKAFQNMARKQEPVFDVGKMTLSYGNLFMSRQKRLYQGKQEKFPYPTCGCPMLNSSRGSGIFQTDQVVLDFGGWGSVRKLQK